MKNNQVLDLIFVHFCFLPTQKHRKIGVRANARIFCKFCGTLLSIIVNRETYRKFAWFSVYINSVPQPHIIHHQTNKQSLRTYWKSLKIALSNWRIGEKTSGRVVFVSETVGFTCKTKTNTCLYVPQQGRGRRLVSIVRNTKNSSELEPRNVTSRNASIGLQFFFW